MGEHRRPAAQTGPRLGAREPARHQGARARVAEARRRRGPRALSDARVVMGLGRGGHRGLRRRRAPAASIPCSRLASRAPMRRPLTRSASGAPTTSATRDPPSSNPGTSGGFLVRGG